jgi:hypothetical protein
MRDRGDPRRETQNMTITPRLAIAAATHIGDNATMEICPTGLSNAGEAQLQALVREAIAQGMDV